jgi:hypothetical protein
MIYFFKTYLVMSSTILVGNNKNTLFWTDRWLYGQSLVRMVPHLFATISSRARKRTVFEAIAVRRWISDIRGALTLDVLDEYLGLWDILSEAVLQPDTRRHPHLAILGLRMVFCKVSL